MKKTRLGRHTLGPEDLWAEILSRLPVKSLLRFRSVCKSWRSLIEDPGFVRSHLLCFHNNRHETHLLIKGWTSLYDIRCAKHLKITSYILEKDIPSGLWNVISSIDGLFMLRLSPNLMLWNPATRKTLILPPNPKISEDIMKSEYLGLGFDPLSKDYKYAELWYTHPNHILHSVAIYSLTKNSWKTIQFKEGNQWCLFWRDESSILCLRGVLFSLATTRSQGPVELVAFDLKSETFTYSTKLPAEDECDDDDLPAHYGPFSYDTECSLAVVNLFRTKGSGSVWTLEGSGADDVKSWTWSKRYTFASMVPEFDDLAGICKLFYLRRNGEMLLEWKSKITSYNLKSHKEKIVLRKSLDRKAWPYMESLVKLN